MLNIKLRPLLGGNSSAHLFNASYFDIQNLRLAMLCVLGSVPRLATYMNMHYTSQLTNSMLQSK